MQSLNWYIRRLKTMSPSEIAWRLQLAGRDILDRYRIPLGIYPSIQEAVKDDPTDDSKPAFPLVDFDPKTTGGFKKEWRERLISKADLICQHKFTFFELTNHFLGDPIDWHRDHGSGQQSSLAYIGKVDYRDFKRNGDCKLVWEASRHHQLVVLGRAYKITGDLKYGKEVIEQINSWIAQNPFAYGMNWRSPMEISIRILNWTFALDLIAESGLYSGETKKRILYSVYLHLHEVTRKFSRGSSANNHLIGEAAGVFIASCYFSELNNTEKWRRQSWEILNKEIHNQTYDDGCNKELAIGYQLFVAQFFLFSGLVARKTGYDFPADFWNKLEKMLEFTGALVEAGGLPNYGDADDGYVLDLGATHSDAGYLLAAGAILFKRPDFTSQAGDYPEPVFWLLGPQSIATYNDLQSSKNTPLLSLAFPNSGFYLLQCGLKNTADSLSVLFDCGELGYKSIAAHGHADALSFTLRMGGEDVFIDPGTYDYFTFPDFRRYFRKTRAHNTIEIDETDQSEILGPFMWGKRAAAQCLKWQPGPGKQGGLISAEHDGYKRLPDPVIHRRSVELDPESRKIIIKDNIKAHDLHDINMFFHLAAGCRVSKNTDNDYLITTAAGKKLMIAFDKRLAVEIYHGSEKPIMGWQSRSYHTKTPTYTIKCSSEINGDCRFTTSIVPNSDTRQ